MCFMKISIVKNSLFFLCVQPRCYIFSWIREMYASVFVTDQIKSRNRRIRCWHSSQNRKKEASHTNGRWNTEKSDDGWLSKRPRLHSPGKYGLSEVRRRAVTGVEILANFSYGRAQSFVLCKYISKFVICYFVRCLLDAVWLCHFIENKGKKDLYAAYIKVLPFISFLLCRFCGALFVLFFPGAGVCGSDIRVFPSNIRLPGENSLRIFTDSQVIFRIPLRFAKWREYQTMLENNKYLMRWKYYLFIFFLIQCLIFPRTRLWGS